MKHELLIHFLTSSNRGLHQLTPEQAISEIKSLNDTQFECLMKFYDAGLRGNHLRALKLYYNSSSHLREFSPDDLKVITFLTSAKRGVNKLSPAEAVAEIHGLTSRQLIPLCKLYDLGLRGQVLYATQWDGTDELLITAVSFLIDTARGNQQLTCEQAFAEISALNKTELEGLIKYYDAGLRGEHLRALMLFYNARPWIRDFSADDLKVITFLTSAERGAYKLSPADAVAEMNGLNGKQLKILCKLYDLGLRGQILCANQWDATDGVLINAVSFLTDAARGKQQLTFEQAFAEIKSLNEAEVDGLIKYYDAGLRGKHLRSLTLFYSDNSDLRQFASDDLHVVTFLTAVERGENQLAPAEAVAEINGLNEKQLRPLCKLYDLGLRGKHLRQLQVSFALMEQILLNKSDLEQLRSLWMPKISSTNAENIYIVMTLVENTAFAHEVILMCSQEQQQTLFKIASIDPGKLGDFIFHQMREIGQEHLFLRDNIHSLNSFLKQQIDCTADNAFLISRLEQLEHWQQTIIQTNGKQAMFGWCMPNIGVILTEESTTEDLAPPTFDDLISQMQMLLPEHLKPAVLRLRRELSAEDDSSPSMPITKDETILKLFQTLAKAIVRYHHSHPNPTTRRYVHWQEELQAVGSLCREGKITALGNLILSLETPLIVYINYLLKTHAASALQHRLAVHPLMHVHYPQAAVCAFLGIHQSLTHLDPYAYQLTKHTLKTIASQVASAVDRDSLIIAATPDIPEYFISNKGKTVNVNSMDYRKYLSAFIYSLKQYGLYTQLGFTEEASDLVIGSCLLGQLADKETFITQLEEDCEKIFPIRIRNDLRVRLVEQAEQLLISEGILLPKTDRDLIKSRIKTLLMLPAAQGMDDALWADVLTKLNGVQMVMDILGEMTAEEFNDLTIEPFIYKPSGMELNLLEAMASNPLFAEHLFSAKFIAKKSGSIEYPTLKIYCKRYTESELQAPEAIKIRALFGQFNREFPEQMQHFFEEFYTKPGSLHFAIVQLNNNGKDRQRITELLMMHLAANNELFKTTDSLMPVIAHFLRSVDKRKYHKNYVLMKTFLDERLEHLLEYNLLTAYFRTVSLMPAHIMSDAPHNKPAFFTSDRIAFMTQQGHSLRPYLEQLGNVFKQAFHVARNRELSQRPHIELGLFSQRQAAGNSMQRPHHPVAKNYLQS
jgi:hypothetical protein